MIKFVVNEKKRTVVAYFDEDWDVNIFSSVAKMFTNRLFLQTATYPWIKKICSEYKQCGIAKCIDGDIFDVEKGKEIARTKLIVKYNKCMIRCLHYISEKMVDGSEAFIAHCQNKYIKCSKNILTRLVKD